MGDFWNHLYQWGRRGEVGVFQGGGTRELTVQRKPHPWPFLVSSCKAAALADDRHISSAVLFCLLPQLLVSSLALTLHHLCLPSPLHNCPLSQGPLRKPCHLRLPSPPQPRLSGTIFHSWLGQALSKSVTGGGGEGGQRRERRRHSSSQRWDSTKLNCQERALEEAFLHTKAWHTDGCQGTQAGFLCLNFYFCKMPATPSSRQHHPQ